jgi:ATP synthase protein I
MVLAALPKMTEGTPPDPLARLGERLAKAEEGRARQLPGRPAGGANLQQGLSLGLRIGVELVVAVVVGTGLGWAIDWGLGTQPWGTLVLFFLGVAAGMLNVYRAVTRIGGAVGLAQRDAAEAGAARAAKEWDKDEN